MKRIDSKYLIYPKQDQNPDNTRLKVFYTNDWHGQTDNMGGILGGSMQFDSVTGGYVDASRLSGGQKYVLSLIYRCVLAEMLNASFPVLVLDEPTTGLDVQNRELLVNMLRNVSAILSQRGMSLLIPTHDKLLTASADNVISI